jgi:excinuclease UvrABC nuclease subunit
MAYFNPHSWLTPNTYNGNFAYPSGRGIYVLAARKIDYEKKKVRHKILYVGMSLDLRRRLSGHAVLLELRDRFGDVVIFFRNYKSDLRKLERHFIHLFNPPYNIIGRRRGI